MKKESIVAVIPSAVLILAAASGCGTAHTAPRPVAAKRSITSQPAPAAAVQSSSVKRVSFACMSPRGQNLNISYQPSSRTTTFYFNNHCLQHRHIQIKREDRWCINTTTTLVVNPRTQGNKKVTTGGCHFVVTSS